MNNIIDLSNQSLRRLRNAEVKEILVDLGFKPLSKPAMLNTVGKVTSLKKLVQS